VAEAPPRRIFVGDIQGCLRQLDALLEACAFRAGHDRLLPAGDLVRKGPDSVGVLRRLRDLGAEPVLGNHDLRWLETERAADPESAVWLERQPFIRVLPDVVLVHAGLHPRWDEEHLLAPWTTEEIHFAVNVRYCDADGNRPPRDWPPPDPPFVPWDEHYRGARRVVFGHWARRGLVQTPKVIGLDSGCVYGGKLSAWIAEEDRIVQIPGWSGD
jgi:bis(5'-nucleosyl)-tetraphosphatase (symmetrical)